MTTVARAKAVRRQELRRSNAAGPHGKTSRRTERRKIKKELKREER